MKIVRRMSTCRPDISGTTGSQCTSAKWMPPFLKRSFREKGESSYPDDVPGFLHIVLEGVVGGGTADALSPFDYLQSGGPVNRAIVVFDPLPQDVQVLLHVVRQVDPLDHVAEAEG